MTGSGGAESRRRGAAGLYRVLLRVYPRPMLLRHEEEMVSLFLHGRKTARRTGRAALVRFWGRAVLDVVVNALKARIPTLSERRRSRKPIGPTPGPGGRDKVTGDGLLVDVGRDVAAALRGLLRRPAFAATVVATLSLGIGANTAMFSVISGVLLRPLSLPEPHELVLIRNSIDGMGWFDLPVSPALYLDLQERLRTPELVGAYDVRDVNLNADGEPIRVREARSTAGLFDVIGVEPLIGRTFTAAEDVPDGPALAVISHGLWQRLFAERRDVLGQSIAVDGETHTVVGVMPRNLEFTDAQVQLWTPRRIDPAAQGLRSARGNHSLVVLARLPQGAPQDGVAAELVGFNEWIHVEWADMYQPKFGFAVTATPLQDALVASARPALLVLMAAVAAVLLIACANVANLLLFRAEGRRREFALRTALGASRARLMRQLVIEGLVLALVSGTLALGLAAGAVQGLVALRGSELPRADLIGIDSTVLLFTIVVSLATGLLLGLVPGLRSKGASLSDVLTSGGGSTHAGGGGRRWVRASLVVSEIGLSVMLLVGAGLLLRSFVGLVRQDPGFTTESTLSVQVPLSTGRYNTGEQVADLYARLVERVAALPGVQAVSASNAVPLRDEAHSTAFSPGPTWPDGADEIAPSADWQMVTSGYFETVGIEIVRGRDFDSRDGPQSERAIIINETLEQRFFPDDDALGGTILFWANQERTEGRIVGVVRDVKLRGLDERAGPQMYHAHSQNGDYVDAGSTVMSLLVRSTGDPTSLVGEIRSVISGLDPSIPVINVATLSDIVARSVSRPRILLTLIGAFAVVALTLGAVGVYSVLSYAVAQQRRDIGIRVAVGAGRSRIVRHVLELSMRPVMLGVALGVAGALAGSRVLERFLFGVGPADVATYAAVVVLLSGIAVVASYVPARRAARVDPIEVLRAD